MGGNTGYINIVAVMQKYFDQAISGNWSYNPEDYEENQVPLSVMAQDLLTTYKLGWKTSYYQNTYDGKIDEDDIDVLEDDSTYKEEELTEGMNHAQYKSVLIKKKLDFTKQRVFGKDLAYKDMIHSIYIFDKLTQQQLGFFLRPRRSIFTKR